VAEELIHGNLSRAGKLSIKQFMRGMEGVTLIA
jgi:hypothetical protein